MANPFKKLAAMLMPKRRWAQFSLGALLLLVTAMCLVLGFVVVPGERQRRFTGCDCGGGNE